MTIFTFLILAVCRTCIIHEPCIWPCWPRLLWSSVVRASDRWTGTQIFSLSLARDMVNTSFFISSPSLEFTILSSLYITLITISTLLFLAVCRTRVIHVPCIWPSSPRVLHRSVVRASDWCTEVRRFKSCRGLRFFLCPMLMTCWTHHSSFLYRAFTISPYILHSRRFRCSVGFPFWIFYRLIFKGHDKALFLLPLIWCSWTMWSSGHCESQGLT